MSNADYAHLVKAADDTNEQFAQAVSVLGTAMRLPGLPLTTPVGNVGTGEDDLMSYTIPANTMSRDGDAIEFKTGFSSAAGTVKLYIGGTERFSYVIAAGSVNTNYYFIRTGATTAAISDPTIDFTTVLLTGLDFTAPIVVQFTGTGTNDDDIVQTYLSGELYPAG